MYDMTIILILFVTVMKLVRKFIIKSITRKKCVKCFIKFYDLNTVIKCNDCCDKEKFYASSPDENLDYYGNVKLRYSAILKNIPNAENIKTCETLRKHLKGKVSNTDFPIKPA